MANPISQGSASSNGAVRWEGRQIAGWTIYVNRDLLTKEPRATQKALELLGRQLLQIVRELPASAVTELRKVRLYFSPQYAGTPPRAEFHPGADWLKQNGRDPAMAQGVEFTNIMIFEAETARMPNFALHELAHAYHFIVLKDGYGNARVTKAFEVAKASGKYDRVERWNGVPGKNTFEKSYAVSSPMEYFAESTEACFSRNDYFPFTRKELIAHDPEMYDLLIELWGVKGAARSR